MIPAESRLHYAKYLPAVLLLPVLGEPVPTYRPAREVAGYFQALAVARLGHGSLFVVTPEESKSALHLHSTLAAPLVELGYTEGGRLVSLAAAVVAVAALAVVARRLFGDGLVAVLAPVVLWTQPLFARSAHAFLPEALSVALVAGAMATGLLYRDTGQRVWYALALLSLAAGITNHMWEATVALPLVTLFALDRRWREVAGVCLVAAGTAAVVFGLTHLQPASGSTLASYGTFVDDHWRLLLDPRWWVRYWPYRTPWGVLLDPLAMANYRALTGLLFPTALVFTVAWAADWMRRRHDASLVLAAWCASGLAIPFALARGYLTHSYYAWVFLAPVSLSAAVAVRHAVRTIDQRYDPPGDVGRTVASVAVVGMLCAVLAFQVHPVALVTGGGASSDAAAGVGAGLELRTHDVEDASGVAFVGFPRERNMYRDTAYVRVLVYSDLLVTERRVSDPGGPQLVAGPDPPPGCTVAVYYDGFVVESCGSSATSALPGPSPSHTDSRARAPTQ